MPPLPSSPPPLPPSSPRQIMPPLPSSPPPLPPSSPLQTISPLPSSPPASLSPPSEDQDLGSARPFTSSGPFEVNLAANTVDCNTFRREVEPQVQIHDVINPSMQENISQFRELNREEPPPLLPLSSPQTMPPFPSSPPLLPPSSSPQIMPPLPFAIITTIITATIAAIITTANNATIAIVTSHHLHHCSRHLKTKIWGSAFY
ncbi:hypothetical protein ACOSQ2_013966 [Xanthoceras sorbifolium]